MLSETPITVSWQSLCCWICWKGCFCGSVTGVCEIRPYGRLGVVGGQLGKVMLSVHAVIFVLFGCDEEFVLWKYVENVVLYRG